MNTVFWRGVLAGTLCLPLLGACTSIRSAQPVQGDAVPQANTDPSAEALAVESDERINSAEADASLTASEPEKTTATTTQNKKPHATARLTEPQMREISGLAGSERYDDVLYAINDSGNQPDLFAIDSSGSLIEKWTIGAVNRDWEELDSVTLNGQNYLIIGDTGDNLRNQGSVRLHLLSEPDIPKTADVLEPDFTITFTYEDGPRNVEAFSTSGQSLYLLSKEPVASGGRSRSGIYRLQLPETLALINRHDLLVAERVGTLPLRRGNVESALAAKFKQVDLSHPTAMSISRNDNTAYILTYREVLSVQRQDNQSWTQALSKPATRLFSHPLKQAEAMTLTADQVLWLTSEGRGSELWTVSPIPP